MKKTSTPRSLIEVGEVTRTDDARTLPTFVRSAAADRGYADAKQTLSLIVNDDDVAEAFACAAQGNGSACVMAQAGKRLGAKSVYFYRTTAWVDFGYGPIVRFKTSKSIYENVITPFDKGQRDSVAPGVYHLTPHGPGTTLEANRDREKRNREARKARTNPKSIGKRTGVHTERVVMATRAS